MQISIYSEGWLAMLGWNCRGEKGDENRDRQIDREKRERERERRHEIRNVDINFQQGERNEINTSISAVIAAGVNKGLIEPEFARELAMFRVSRSEESDLYAVVPVRLSLAGMPYCLSSRPFSRFCRGKTSRRMCDRRKIRVVEDSSRTDLFSTPAAYNRVLPAWI